MTVKGIKKSYSEWIRRGGGFNVQLFFDKAENRVFATTTFNGWQEFKDSDIVEIEPPFPETVKKYNDFKEYVLNEVTW